MVECTALPFGKKHIINSLRCGYRSRWLSSTEYNIYERPVIYKVPVNFHLILVLGLLLLFDPGSDGITLHHRRFHGRHLNLKYLAVLPPLVFSPFSQLLRSNGFEASVSTKNWVAPTLTT